MTSPTLIAGPPAAQAESIAALGANMPVVWALTHDDQISFAASMLRFFSPTLQIHVFPSWDTIPFDRLSPKSDIMAERLASLTQWLANPPTSGVLLASIQSLMQKVVPPHHFRGLEMTLRPQARVDQHMLQTFLHKHAYQRVVTVRSVGEYSIRGSLIDLFPAGHAWPIRIDRDGDTVDQLSTFDPLSQRRLNTIDSLQLLPVHEIVLTDDNIDRFRANYRKINDKFAQQQLYQAVVEQRRYHPGIEAFLPLFYDTLVAPLSLLNQRAVRVVLPQEAKRVLSAMHDDIQQQFLARTEQHQRDPLHSPQPPQPHLMFVDAEAWQQQCDALAAQYAHDGFRASRHQPLPPQVMLSHHGSADAWCAWFKQWRQAHPRPLLLTASQQSGVDRWLHLLSHDTSIPQPQIIASRPQTLPSLSVAVLPAEQGYVGDDYILLTAADVWGAVSSIRVAKRTLSAEAALREASALLPNDLVVHADHGIAKFVGLEVVNVGGADHDCVKLLFAGDDKLYLPVENMGLISRYGASHDDVVLDKLGAANWQERRAAMKQRLREMAEQLLKTAALRQLQSTQPLLPNIDDYDRFCASFPHTETPDQLAAIEQILKDLASDKPMDRLICGDVGFGKTEVALRAAFVAASCGKTVVVLTPTTLLCQQHYRQFNQRLQPFGLKVVQLSRMVTAADMRANKKAIAAGEVNVIVGTHAVLAESIEWRNLGLLIIDEEQHFGVGQKERLKDLMKDVHVLTLSATPIPRTLQFALSGLRELSLITTPPPDRLAVSSNVMLAEPSLIKEAIEREIYRGGQVFYVCPRIKDLAPLLDQLMTLMPQLRVAVAHGQMSPVALNRVMSDFVAHKLDLILTTNIIESGLDIPNANTLIVHRSDLFGLAQLYQLRGRVGRSKRKAYAYFTTPANLALNEMALSRLKIIESLDYLGAGMQLASHDMDLRGSGNLLGEDQSGHVREVGIELYQKMLAEAVSSVRQGGAGAQPEEVSVTMNLGQTIMIPHSYIPDLSLRMAMYRQLNDAASSGTLEAARAELIDRFGLLPESTANLLLALRLKHTCMRLNIVRLDLGPKGAIITMGAGVSAEQQQRMIQHLQSEPLRFKLRPDQKIMLTLHHPWPKVVDEMIEQLAKWLPSRAES